MFYYFPCQLFLIFFLSYPFFIKAESDSFSLELARAYESEMRQLVSRLSHSVICILPQPDPTAFKISRRRGGGGGSGVIIDPEGYALTNFHVTEYAQVMVGMSDGRVRRAQIMARDESSDIVLLKIEGGPFKSVELGDSDTVEEGDLTLAMGNPFGLAVDYKPTTTLGILSGVNRYLDGLGFGHNLIYTGVLQTDTPINPGNSGGPLFDRKGRLVGINGRISLGGERKVSVGVGYAIPINMIRNFLDEMKRGHDPNHGILGVVFGDQNRVTVKEVVVGSPAEKAGILSGDIIKKVGTRDVHDFYDVIHHINSHPAGHTLDLLLKRKTERGTERSFKVRPILESRPLPVRWVRAAPSLSLKESVPPQSSFPIMPEGGEKGGEKGGETLLQAVLSLVRKKNIDALNSSEQGYVWSRVSVPDESEKKFNFLSGGYVTSDAIHLFRGFDNRLIRRELHGEIQQGVRLVAIHEKGGWINSSTQSPRLLQEAEKMIWKESLERQRCFYGLSESEGWSIELESEDELFDETPCFVLKEQWKGKKTQKYYVDCRTGVIIATSWLNAKSELTAVRRFLKFAKIEEKFVPIIWQDRSLDGRVLRVEEVMKVGRDIDIPKTFFNFQPSYAF